MRQVNQRVEHLDLPKSRGPGHLLLHCLLLVHHGKFVQFSRGAPPPLRHVPLPFSVNIPRQLRVGESLRRPPPSLHFSPLNLSIQTMKDIIVILITTSTVNCFLSVPWVQPLPQIYPQPEDNKFQGWLFISFSMFFYANLIFF